MDRRIVGSPWNMDKKLTNHGMKRFFKLFCLAAILSLFSTTAHAGVAYADPTGGWTYIYTGNAANGLAQPGGAALDNTWDNDNGSDEWDASARGAGVGAPGGAESLDGILTIEDAVNIGSGTGNNRKIYFTHNMAQDGVTDNAILNNGVTISFRARLTPQDAKSEIPMPNGWGIYSDGKGMFGVRQIGPSGGATEGLISFSLTQTANDANDTPTYNVGQPGLVMNRLNGDAPAAAVDINEAGTLNLLPVDPTVFHEFWITIQANDATPGNGTHTVSIYIDGGTTPTVFNVTAGTGDDESQNYLALGLNNSTSLGAFDTDFYAYKPGIFAPLPLTPPGIPGNVTVANGDMQVTLSWTAAALASGYNIKRSSVSGGSYTIVGTSAGTTFTDTGLVNGTSYYYVITATNTAGESANSTEVVGIPNPIVTGLTATGGTNQITLGWDAYPNAASYTVRRSSASGGPFSDVATGLTSTSYIDTSVQSGRTYYYVVIAVIMGGGQSGQSAEASTSTAPAAPTGLSASLWAATAIRLDWTTTNQVVTGYSIERSLDGVTFTPLTTVPATPRNYVDAGLSASTTYFYRILATNPSGNSDYSNIASNTTPSGGWNVNFANSALGQPANNPAPTPPGYLQDISEVFGPRGNGFNYGWDRDIQADSRWRMNAASPDLRYDTFTHLQKIPVPSATWEFEIPNGFYWIHIVSGDPTATDSIFQHSVEGVLTRTYIPVAGAWWGEFTNTCAVLDGRLTITSGPATYGLASTNNKINFIDIYPAEAIPVAIDQQPQPQTVTEFRPVSLSVTVTNVPFTPSTPFYGSEPVFYQWYQNGVPVPNGTNATLSFPLAQTTNSGDYFVIATNFAGSVTSQVATLTVNEDTDSPLVVSVASLDGYSIGVCFNELLDLSEEGFNTALDRVNYWINGDQSAVTNVTFRPDHKSVRLALANPVSGSFTVYVEYVSDAAGNQIIPGSSTTTSTALGFTALDVGAPAQAGSHYTCDSNIIEIVGGGRDIWDTSDQAYLAGRPVVGDFDVKVRVEGLTLPAQTGPGTIAKAALLARETLDANSRGLHLSVNPPAPGRNQGEAGQRPTTGGATAAWHTNSYTPAAIPNAWLRMSRVGNIFTGYRSSNGTDWIQFARTNQTYPASMMVGLGVTAHTNAVSLVATGTFSNFMLTQPSADFAITKIDTPDPTAVGTAPDLTYTLTVTNRGPDNGSIVTVTDPLPAGLTFISATASQGSCANAAGTVTCNLTNINSGSSATVTIVVRPTAGGIITNTAVVATSAIDPNTANNSATAVTRVLATTRMTGLNYTGGSFTVSIATTNGLTYSFRYKNDLNDPMWTIITQITGDGTVRQLTDPSPAPVKRFYSVLVE
jgi:uncharacterized repeat protein (TIGR01451 family)